MAALTGWLMQDRAVGMLGAICAAVDPNAHGGEYYGPMGSRSPGFGLKSRMAGLLDFSTTAVAATTLLRHGSPGVGRTRTALDFPNDRSGSVTVITTTIATWRRHDQ